MPADNTAPIIAAARHRHELTRSKAIQALRELDSTGAPVTFAAIADTAGVSRSWLYNQHDIRRDIERLREATTRAPGQNIPAAQRSSNPSLTTRLQAANQRIRELTHDNQRLRRQLAHALGGQRVTGHSSTSNQNQPERGLHGHNPTTTTPPQP
jgi:hypothetical protein